MSSSARRRLEGWLGRFPDDDTRHHLTLMRDLQRLFAGTLLLSELIGRRDPEAELTALTPEQFRAAIARGELRGTPELLFVLGKMNLAGFAAAQRGRRGPTSRSDAPKQSDGSGRGAG